MDPDKRDLPGSRSAKSLCPYQGRESMSMPRHALNEIPGLDAHCRLPMKYLDEEKFSFLRSVCAAWCRIHRTGNNGLR